MSAKPIDGQCCEQVPWGMMQYSQCSRRAVVERDGKKYCRQHDPEEKKKRRAASNAKWQKKNAKRFREIFASASEPLLAEALEKIARGEGPEKLIAQNAIKARKKKAKEMGVDL